MLLAHALGLARLDLYVHFDRPLAPAERDRVRELVRRRGDGVPVAYLVGEREFYARPFAVTPAVLVPRPETETLVEAALQALAGRAAPRVLDVGTGAGVIAITILLERPDATAWASDLDPAALEVARQNARRHGVLERLVLRAGDLLEPWQEEPGHGRLDAVLSNPPYVARGDPLLDPAVARHEPALALHPPEPDPLHFVRRLAREAPAALAPAGVLAVEVGFGSAAEGLAVLGAHGWREVRAVPDLAGIPRVLLARRPAPGA